MQIDWKNQIKSYSFWLAVASACLLLLQAVGKPLGLNVNEDMYMSVVNAILGVFVLFGIIAPTAVVSKDDEDTMGMQYDNKDEKNDNHENGDNIDE